MKAKAAFPSSAVIEKKNGMTLREYYAGLAMQGILASPKPLKAGEDRSLSQCECLANYAVVYADALIAELQKEQG